MWLSPLLPVQDWFDWSQSKYVVEQNSAKQKFATEIKALVARQEVFSGVPLAMAERTIPYLVAVSDRLAKAIADEVCTGVLFREPQDWKDPVDPV